MGIWERGTEGSQSRSTKEWVLRGRGGVGGKKKDVSETMKEEI